jgi:hypothetical protein
MYVREGIVMASDSRLTLNAQLSAPSGQTPQTIPAPVSAGIAIAVGQTDTNYKTFLTSMNVGISTYGQADIQGVPITGYIDSFIRDIAEPQKLNVDTTAEELIKYFQKHTPQPNIMFHVAGYVVNNSILDQHIWNVEVAANKKTQLNPPGQQGASWGGEGDILGRIIQPAAQIIPDNTYQPFPFFSIPFNFFTLQDAIDFSVFAIRSTIDALRFQPRPKTVGGPIDVLVIKPTEAFWISRKELHMS